MERMKKKKAKRFDLLMQKTATPRPTAPLCAYTRVCNIYSIDVSDTNRTEASGNRMWPYSTTNYQNIIAAALFGQSASGWLALPWLFACLLWLIWLVHITAGLCWPCIYLFNWIFFRLCIECPSNGVRLCAFWFSSFSLRVSCDNN